MSENLGVNLTLVRMLVAVMRFNLSKETIVVSSLEMVLACYVGLMNNLVEREVYPPVSGEENILPDISTFCEFGNMPHVSS